jgi:catechol 2,3-dioxygenase-like lactoylglutathione lyase family enzyme
MALHRMNSITIGVPNVEETAAFYRDFNLTENIPGVFSTADGGEQLRIEHSPVRRLVEMNIGAENPDDVDRVASQLATINADAARSDTSITATDPGSGVRVRVAVAPSIKQAQAPAPVYNGPGRIDRDGRSPRLPHEGPPRGARPRKLGHCVVGSTDIDASDRFFTQGIGFKVSDSVARKRS